MSSFTAEVGDMFRPQHWPGPGVNTKCSSWHFLVPDPNRGRRETLHKVVLRHCTATGNWVLFVDGRNEMHGYEPINNAEFNICFKLRPNDVTIAVARMKNLVTHHRLLLNSTEIPSFENQPPDTYIEDPPKKISINKYDIKNDGGKPTAFYEITTIAGDGSLPGKVFNPFTKQLSPEFLDERRHALELYLNMLLGNDKVVCYTDFLCFVGLSPITGSSLR